MPTALLFAAAGPALLGCALLRSAEDAPSVAALAWTGLLASGAWFCFALAGAIPAGPHWRRALLIERAWPTLGVAGSGLVLMGMLGLSQLLDSAIQLCGARYGGRPEVIANALPEARTPEILLAVLGLVLAPAIAEELLFRGLLLRALQRIGGLSAALVGTSLLFGACHRDPAQAAAVVLGLYLAAVVAVTGSVRSAIVCHVGNNLLALGGPPVAALISRANWLPSLSTVALLAAAGAFILSARQLARAAPEARRRWCGEPAARLG